MFLCLLFILCMLCTVYKINGDRRTQLIFVWGFCFICFILTGTRWHFGGDWSSYLNYFNETKTLDFNRSEFQMDYGWILLTWVVKTICPSYIAFQFLMAIIIFFTTYRSIKYFSPVPLLSYMVLFSLNSGGIAYVRTVIATSIFLYSYIYVSQRRFFPFLLCVLFATSIHFSSIIGLPLYWIYHNKSAYSRYLIIFLCCSIFFYVFGRIFFSNISLFGSYFQYKIDHYITGQESGVDFGETISPEKAMVNHLIKKGIILFFLYVYCRKEYAKNLVLRGFTNIFIAGSILYCSLAPLSTQFGRMAPYMDCVEIFLVAFIFSYMHKSANKILFFVIVIAMSIIRLWGHVLPDPLIYNYHNIFFI